MSSYLTVAAAQTYFDERLGTEPWDNATVANQTKALAQATKIIDRLNFLGEKTVSTQDNQFPRNADTTVPQPVLDATAEIALALLDGVDPQLEYENLRFTSQAYANIKSAYSENLSVHYLAGVPSFVAWTLLQPFLRDPFQLDLKRQS